MSIVLAFTPARRITAIESTGVQGKSLDVDADRDADRGMANVAKAFAASQAEGLFTLATETLDAALPPSMVYWRSFAGRYLTRVVPCPADAELATIPAPEAAELDALVLSAPPMQGAEYLNREALADVWSDLDAWVRAEGSDF